MKIRQHTIAILTALLLTTSVAVAESRTVKIRPEDSSVVWTGKKVTGSHEGTLKVKGGTAHIENGKLTGGSFQVDMTSLEVVDIKDPKYNKKLNDHLRSSDFFSIEEFPVSTFTITSAVPIEGAKEGEPNYNITGELEVKGTKSSISFPAVVKIGKDKSSAEATVTIDRTKYGIRYGSGKFFENLGDKLIYDDFEVKFTVQGS